MILMITSIILLIVLLGIFYLGKEISKELNVRAIHHGYFLIISIFWWCTPVQIVCIIIGLDDIYQHMQHLNGNKFYMSPLKKFYARYLWKFKLVQDITKFFDNILK